MIRLFNTTDTDYSSNGDFVLRPIKAKVKKADNSDYYLSLELPIEYAEYITEGRIVVANTPQGDQPFRLSNPTKARTKITVKAWHVFYDSENYLIKAVSVANKTCAEALSAVNGATDETSPFTTDSNITALGSYEGKTTSLYGAINDLLKVYGGHLVRDGYDIQIKSSIGTDNGITVQYAKNLKDISVSEKWDDVATKIMPVGKDGILLNAVNPSADVYVESATQYDIPYSKVVQFSQDINEKDYPTELAYKTALVNDLSAKATAYVAQSALPQVNYKLSANLDRMTDIGDTIEVIDSRLGVNLMTQVISYEWDCIAEIYTQVEFGNFAPTIDGLYNNIINAARADTSAQITAATDAMADSIIDRGTTDGWTWVKYASGRSEAVCSESGDGITKALPFSMPGAVVFATSQSGGAVITATVSNDDAVVTTNGTATVGIMVKN